ncbi:hypothetical protein ACF0H5_013037 [Mactra antiquata]
MCLACIDPIIDALKRINPFKKKRKITQVQEADDFDRDNITLPYLMEEKRTVLTSDPGVSDHAHDDDNVMTTTTVLTMKKVSSLALV